MKWHNVNNGIAIGVYNYLVFTDEPIFDDYIRIITVQGHMMRSIERLVEYTTEDYCVDPGGRRVRTDWRELDKEEDVG